MFKVIHVGPSSKLKGGIASVIKTYENNTRLFVCSGFNLSFIKTPPFQSPAGYLIFFLVTIPRCVFSFIQADIIHYHVASNGSFFRKFLLFYISRLLKKKNIMHLHGGGFFEFFEKSSPLARRAISSFINNCNAIIVVSTEFKVRVNLLVTSGSPVIVIPNSSEEFELAANSEYCTQDRGYILFAGKLAEYKGLQDLIQALSLLKARGEAKKLIVIGSGDIAKWKRICADYDIEDLVEFRGWVSGSEKIQAYQESALFCLPSYVESFGISALEAMLSRKPLVCTRLGGFLDLVEDGENGYLINAGAPEELAAYISKILNDKSLAKSMGDAGFERAMSFFTVKVAIAETLKVYNLVA